MESNKRKSAQTESNKRKIGEKEERKKTRESY